ncbi:hypothetical protein O5O45_16380 [Hahella aquimaris]|uniref:hypothetical protein n=1 Tax=Hahella sp. HNIBRBA332 TaxID=3015983 RepID=UPI00273CB602|nr:hypothetical protein [Hahella sp. HNIBRBA332]WLQ11323.1 hypothetical protein O5O45_16380 [Hahella sp. HNIBRBA332]
MFEDIQWTVGDTPKEQGVYIIAVETYGMATISASYWSPIEGWASISPDDKIKGYIPLREVTKKLPYFWKSDDEPPLTEEQIKRAKARGFRID